MTVAMEKPSTMGVGWVPLGERTLNLKRGGQDLGDPNSATSLLATWSSLLDLSKSQFPHLENGLQSPTSRRLGKLEKALLSFEEVPLLICVRAGLASGPHSRRRSRRKLGEGSLRQAACENKDS